MRLDLAIRGGTVVDGTGAEPARADVGVRDGRIAVVGEVGAARETIDASGRVVTPGFVDLHSHSDFTLLVDPRAISAIHQGVTTEVVGNCGFGCFPLLDRALAPTAIYGFDPAVGLDWTSAGEYFDRLDQARPAVNVASLVPNGQLRLSTVGLEDRPADAAELAEMRRLLDEALREGAWGYSTGLEYAAERGAPESEIASLCAVCAAHDGLYATHTRHRDAGSPEAVAEAVGTADRAGVRLQVSHLVPRNGLEATHRCLEHVELAAGRGQDVAFDMHTRLFGTTFLATVLPPDVLESPSALRDALTRPERREAMRGYRSILSAGGDWSRVVLLDNDLWPEYARLDLETIARSRGQDAFAAALDLLVRAVDDPGRLMVLIDCNTEEQQRLAFGHPLCVPGSDATTLAPDGPLAGRIFHGAYTWAAWYLRFCVGEARLHGLPEAVRRLTAAPAARLGLTDRGILRPGARADVAVFDPDAIREAGTRFEPSRTAVGMHAVVVNGALTLLDGEPTGQRAGEVLRRRS